MAGPISTGTLLTLAGISAGGKILGGIYDRIANRRLYELQEEVLNRQVQFNQDLARRARGKFTDSELAQIRAAAEPQLQAASGNIAARLGTSSPAAIALLQQAQQAPILAAQQAATEAYAPSLKALSETVSQRLGQLSGDKSFIGDLKAILEAYKTLEKLVGSPKKPTGTPDASNNPEDPAPQALNMLLGQGYQYS